MISRKELRKLSRSRLKDATLLFDNRRYDSAVYVCGYAIELALKSRICRTLKWAGFPETNSEFQGLTSFRTHNFDILLRLSGVAQKIKADHMEDWWTVSEWRPDYRYRPIGSSTREDVKEMIIASETLIKALR